MRALSRLLVPSPAFGGLEFLWMNQCQILDRPIAFHRSFVKLTGTVKGALFLSQALYWQNRCQHPDGWWWKIQEDWSEETGFTRRELESARRDCVRWVKHEIRGVPSKSFYTVDANRLEQDLSRAMLGCTKPPTLIGENRQPSMAESANLGCTKPPTYSTKTSSEITPETTTPLPPDSAAVALGGGDGKSNILKDWKPTPEQLRLGALFGRRETTPWADKETKSLKVISPIPEEDLALIEKYYRIPPVDPQHDYHRRDLYSLLNNWTGELDRARLAVNSYANPRPVNGQPAPENVWALGKRRDAVDEEIAEVRRGLPDLYPEEREKLRKLRSIRQALTIQIAQSPA
jgi:hypothetical protein